MIMNLKLVATSSSFQYIFNSVTSNGRIRSFATICSVSEVELTSTRYKVNKGQYATLNDQDIGFFRSVLDSNRVLTDEADLKGHNVDWLSMVRGSSKLLLKPKTTEEVSAILKYCNEKKLAVCPQGGNTSQSGGSVPVFDEILLSTTLMNKIISLDEWSGVLVAQAGCVLETLNDYLMERNFIMPLDLGAKGSCQIGGNVSTNAGGLRLVRYGSLHSTVLGVEAVLPNGDVMDCLSLMKKDNTGYDLKHLFIGSEGTLGVVTKVAIQCPVKPKSIKLAYLGLNTFQDVLETQKRARRELGEILSSLEYIDATSVGSVVENLKIKNPLGEHPFYMIIEASGSNESHDEEKLNTFLENILLDGVVADGTVAFDSTQMQTIWKIRERIPDALLLDGYYYSYDLSIPLTTFDELVQDVQREFGKEVIRVCGFGHLGDGNIHLLISVKEYTSELSSKLEPFVYEWTGRKNGSVSAEHGLGFKKRNQIYFSKSSQSVKMMKSMKELFDPNQILNPYKVLPEN